MLFDALYWERVSLEHLILKPNMIVSGYEAEKREGYQEVSKATLNCFNRCVPAAVPVIAFLSGGQDDTQVLSNLAQINKEPLPTMDRFFFLWTHPSRGSFTEMVS